MSNLLSERRRLRWRDRLWLYARLIRLDRPIGTLLVLWPTLWALWLSSGGRPDPHVFAVFVAGAFLMRSAGCAINDYADRDFDPHVQRTRDRPLATGEVTANEALAVFSLLALAAFGLVLTLDRLTVLLAVAGLLLAVTYPFLKRITSLPQLFLGLAFAWSVPMAYAAQTGALPPASAWLLFAAVMLWTTAYDTMYAMVDRDDDVHIGVKSTAILFGRADRAVIGLLQALVLLALWVVGRMNALGLWYHLGLLSAAGYAVYQQVLIRDRERSRCFRAFLSNNGFGATIFVGIALHYVFAPA